MKIWQDEKKLQQNLTRCIFFISKSDGLYFFQFKFWRVVFFSIQNLTRNEIFNAKSCFWKTRKKPNMSFSWSKMNQNVIFWMQTLFQNLTCRKVLKWKSNALYFFKIKSDALQNFYFKIWHVVFFYFKIWHVVFFYFKIWQVVKFFTQNLLFKWSFQIPAESSSNCYQNQKTACWTLTMAWGWTMTMAWGKKSFYECVACVCLRSGTIFLVIAFFMALEFLMGVMTISYALTVDLNKSLWNSETG